MSPLAANVAGHCARASGGTPLDGAAVGRFNPQDVGSLAHHLPLKQMRQRHVVVADPKSETEIPIFDADVTPALEIGSYGVAEDLFSVAWCWRLKTIPVSQPTGHLGIAGHGLLGVEHGRGPVSSNGKPRLQW